MEIDEKGMSMKSEVKGNVGKWTILALSDRVDTSTAPQLEADCKVQLDGGVKWLALDFSGVPYISSAGLRILMKTHKSLQAQSGGLSLISPNQTVSEVLDICGFKEIIPTVDGTSSLE